MKTHNPVQFKRMWGGKLRAAVVAVMVASSLTLTHAQGGDRIKPPIVPAEIAVDEGYEPFLMAHAIGMQNYICQLVGSSLKWMPVGPQATLFNDAGHQILTHYLSPNPLENGTARATWQHSRDTSAAWAVKIKESSDPTFVQPDAIPWFLLKVAGTLEGPTGGKRLTPADFIHRVNTAGGNEPSTGCAAPANINARAFVPYTADYIFYAYEKHQDEK